MEKYLQACGWYKIHQQVFFNQDSGMFVFQNNYALQNLYCFLSSQSISPRTEKSEKNLAYEDKSNFKLVEYRDTDHHCGRALFPQ